MNKPRKRPPANTMNIRGDRCVTHFDDAGRVTAVYINGQLAPRRSKPKWWQFWRMFEYDPYNQKEE
jgi:hypothetical protein